VAVFTMTWAFFVLPHALVAIPVATTLAPRVADAWQRGRGDEVRSIVERSAQVVLPLLLVGGAAMAALSWPIARIAGSFGQAASQGFAPIAHALAMFGFGLCGYGLAFVMTRVLFSVGDVKRAAVLVTCAAGVGVVSMVVAARIFPDGERAAALALGYGVAQTVSALLLTWRVRSRTGSPRWNPTGRITAAALLAAGLAGVTMLVVQARFGSGRAASVAAILAAGCAGAVVFAAVVSVLTGIRPAALLRLGRGAA
jgi:putative peptidoglycan lipid II flippase